MEIRSIEIPTKKGDHRNIKLDWYIWVKKIYINQKSKISKVYNGTVIVKSNFMSPLHFC